jgi:hypothetical protein
MIKLQAFVTDFGRQYNICLISEDEKGNQTTAQISSWEPWEESKEPKPTLVIKNHREAESFLNSLKQIANPYQNEKDYFRIKREDLLKLTSKIGGVMVSLETDAVGTTTLSVLESGEKYGAKS